jgi:hypothetical protein
MRKHKQKDIDSLVNKILSETLEEKANSLVSRLKHTEVNELGGMGGEPHPKFGKKNFSKMSPEEIEDLLRDYGNDDDDDLGYATHSGDFDGDDSDDDYELSEGDSEICECGGGIYEGTCNECGQSYGAMDEDFDSEENFDSEVNVGGCKAVKDTIESKGGEPDELDLELIKRYNCKSLNESLKGGQKKLDKNKNNKIDSEDFAMLRKGKKTETKESLKGGQKKLDKNKNNKIDTEDFKLMNKDKKSKKESLKLSESELIDLIESIVKEDLKGTKPKGLSEYEKAHKGSGKENEDYIKSVTKKMKDYLKDGSKGDYDMNPKMFPQGNGEIEKMDKKGFEISDEGQDFDYETAGLNIPDYDEVQPNEDWVSDNLKGSSKTGNNSKWANAVETPVNNKFNEFRKNRKLNKIKQQSYNKASQPVFNEKPGQETGKGINIKLESTDKQTKVLNEEFTKIQHLMGYSRKTQ